MIVNLFLRQVLADPLADHDLVDHTGEPVGAIELSTKRRVDLLDKLPFVHARHVTGSEHNADLGTDYAAVVVDVYADTEFVAGVIADLVRKTLYAAWRRQTVYPAGHIATYECTVTPHDVPRGELAAEHDRYVAEYRLLIRPAA